MMSTTKSAGRYRSRGLSIDDELYNRALEKARSMNLSFSDVARLAIARDLANPQALEEEIRQERSDPNVTVSTEEVARMLNLSVSMIRKRQRDPGDPLRRARSRLGKKRPMQFSLAKIRELQRTLG